MFLAVPCFKCLHYFGFCGAKIDNGNKESCSEGATLFRYLSAEVKFLCSEDSHFWQATLGFFGLPNDPPDVINGLINNLITLLCAILVTRYFSPLISGLEYPWTYYYALCGRALRTAIHYWDELILLASQSALAVRIHLCCMLICINGRFCALHLGNPIKIGCRKSGLTL